jgi:hypothetical protein
MIINVKFISIVNYFFLVICVSMQEAMRYDVKCEPMIYFVEIPDS